MLGRVIDASNSIETFGIREHGLRLQIGQTATVMHDGSVSTYGDWANGIVAELDTTVNVDGRVHSFGGAAVLTKGTVDVGIAGNVTGYHGVIFYDDSEFPALGKKILNNHGVISALMTAVQISSIENVITNTGKIIGYCGIDNNFNIGGLAQTLVLNNAGLIRSTEMDSTPEWAAAVRGAAGSNAVTNTGRIEGNIALGALGDLYDGRGGTVTGSVFLWDGDDTAFGGDGAETFFAGKGKNFIDGGAGADTLEFRDRSPATVDLRVAAEQRTSFDSWDTIRNIENLDGSPVADMFIGNEHANSLSGGGGDDSLRGEGGNDYLNGAWNNDVLDGGGGVDTAVFSGNISNYTITLGADGAFTVTDNRWSRDDGVDRLTNVELALFGDRIFRLSKDAPPGDVLTPSVNLTFIGTKRADTFIGGAGDDYLNGALGRDRLTGGEGKDVFVFNTKLKSNVDTIADFQRGEDMIQLSRGIFSKIGMGALKKSAFHVGTKAKDAHDRIIYNKKTGAVSYDADGSGKKYAAVKFAQLENKVLLSASDFWVL
ncbi:calcium-binding protein [Microvirga sp. P5_D2]